MSGPPEGGAIAVSFPGDRLFAQSRSLVTYQNQPGAPTLRLLRQHWRRPLFYLARFFLPWNFLCKPGWPQTQ